MLTAHPTEARSKVNIEIFKQLEQILSEGVRNNFLFNDGALASKIRMLWLYPLSKIQSPTVPDAADHIFAIIFAPDVFDFI